MKEQLQLAYIIGTFPNITTTFIDREIRVLRQLGLDLQTLSIRRPKPGTPLSTEQQVFQQDTIYLLPLNWIRFFISNLYLVLLHPFTYFGTLIYLLSRPHPNFSARFKSLLHFAEGVYAAYLLRSLPLDRLHAHFLDRAATVALVAGRFLRLPYSVTAHANDIYKDPVLLFEKIKEATFVVTVSQFNKSYILDLYPDLGSDKIHVLHPWVDLEHFQPPPTNNTIHDELRVLSVGRLVEKKGHQYLIEACHLLKLRDVDFECHIIGDGPLKSELKADINRYKLQEQVHLLGAQPQSKVLDSLAWCDVFVLACVIAQDGDRDGMPVALAEAMAMEVPVISTNIVGIGELVQPGAGYLTPPNDVVALARAIKSMTSASPAERSRMGKYGRTIIAEEFDVFKGTGRLAGLFYQTVAPKNGVSLQ